LIFWLWRYASARITWPLAIGVGADALGLAPPSERSSFATRRPLGLHALDTPGRSRRRQLHAAQAHVDDLGTPMFFASRSARTRAPRR
jgi:hypothetical protein